MILPIDELHHFSRWLNYIKTSSQDIPSSRGNPMISIEDPVKSQGVVMNRKSPGLRGTFASWLRDMAGDGPLGSPLWAHGASGTIRVPWGFTGDDDFLVLGQ